MNAIKIRLAFFGIVVATFLALSSEAQEIVGPEVFSTGVHTRASELGISTSGEVRIDQDADVLFVTDGDAVLELNDGFVAEPGAGGLFVAEIVSSEELVAIIAGLNQRPTANSDSVSAQEDLPVSVLLTGSDPQDDPLTFAVVTDPSNGSLSGTAPNLVYTPDPNYFGSDSFTFKVNDGSNDSLAATVDIAVSPDNDRPFANPQSISLDANSSFSGQLEGFDVEQDVLTFAIDAEPAFGSVTVDADGSFVYAPNPFYDGPDQFTYTVSDYGKISEEIVVSVTVVPVVYTGTVMIVGPADGSVVLHPRPTLKAEVVAGQPYGPDSFDVYLDGVSYGADVMIEGSSVMFMPTFNLSQGTHTYKIEYLVNGTVIAEDSVTFTIDSEIPGSTQFTGRVLSTLDAPLVNVRVTARSDSNSFQTYTDSNGYFVFNDIDSGELVFQFATDEVTNSGEYTPVNLMFEVLEDQRTVWERPVYLVGFDSSKGTVVSTDIAVETVIENPDIPGVQLILAPGTTITFPDGSSSAPITIVEVPVEKSPNCLGADFMPGRLFAVQPENAILSEPAQFVVPDYLGMPEGSKLDFYSLNTDTGVFVQSGLGVIENGMMKTLPGSGIINLDWHAPTPRRPDIPDIEDPDPNDDPLSKEEVVCSTMNLQTGALMEDHFIPSYRSLGVPRTLQLHYSSVHASPDFVASATFNFGDADQQTPPEIKMAVSSPFGSSHTHFDGSQVTEESALAGARLSLEGVDTGVYPVEIRAAGTFSFGGGEVVVNSARTTEVTVIDIDDLCPAMGKGWTIGNTSRLLFDGDQVQHLSGDGKLTNFRRANYENLGFEADKGDSESISDYAISFETSRDEVNIVERVGFIEPTEGFKMLALKTGDGTETFDESKILIPLDDMPQGVTKVTYDMNVLTTMVSSIEGVDGWAGYQNCFDCERSLYLAHSLTTGYPEPVRDGSDQGSTSGSYSVGDGGVYLPIPKVPGGDTGYERSSGWRRMEIDIFNKPSNAFPDGKNSALEIDISNIIWGFDFIYEAGYADRMVLIDNIRFEGVDPELLEDSVLLGEDGDYSFIKYDPVSELYTRTLRDGSKQVFNADGLQVAEIDRNDNETTFAYVDGDGDGEACELSTVTDPVGLVTTLSYTDGLLSSITDPANRVTGLIYDQSGHLIRIDSPDGNSRQFEYEPDGRMNAQIDGENHRRTYEYISDSSRLASVNRPDGSTYDYRSQQAAGLPVLGGESSEAPADMNSVEDRGNFSVDGRGNAVQTKLNDRGQPEEKFDAAGELTTYGYDSSQNLVRIEEANGNVIERAYDVRGNLIETYTPFNGARTTIEYDHIYNLPTRIVDPLLRETTMNYDANGNLLSSTDAAGEESAFTYNAEGQILTITDLRGHVTTFTYDAFGRVATIVDPLSRTQTMSYDAAGNLIQRTDPGSRVTAYEYDGANRLTKLIAADTGETEFEYDGNGMLVKVTDPLERETTTAYDNRQRPVLITDALGRETAYEYDEVGNIVKITDPGDNEYEIAYDERNLVSDTIDPLNRITSRLYDELGNLVELVRPDNTKFTYSYDLGSRLTGVMAPDGSVASREYDIVSRVISSIDELSRETQYTYDLLDRLTTVTDPLSRVTTMFYDEMGNLTRLERPDGVFETTEYDDLNRAVLHTAADGGETEYAYTPAGNLHTVTDANEGVRTYAYDSVNRRVSETDPNGLTRLWGYDLAGNAVSRTRKDGLVLTYQYDALNRLTQKNLPAIGSHPADTVTYAYDILGNLTTVSDSDSTVTDAYDEISRIQSSQQSFGGNDQTLSFLYDVLDRRSSATDIAGTIGYGYDSRDRLTSLTDRSLGVTSIAYDAASQIDTLEWANGAIATYTFDLAGQLSDILHTDGIAPIEAVAYTYDLRGNRLTESRGDGNTRTFAYDNVDRLLTSVNDTLPVSYDETYTYDLMGNRTNGLESHDADNRLLGNASYTYGYDDEGNLISRVHKTDSSDATYFAYDAESRLISATKGSDTVTYSYDGYGRRIAKNENGTVKHYVLDGQSVCAELDGSGNLQSSNVYLGMDFLISRHSSTGTLYVHADGLGSTIGLSDENGDVAQRFRYGSFGQPEVLDGAFATSPAAPLIDYLYTGREWEPQSLTYFYRARFYDPYSGRFLGQDPLGSVDGPNRYSYVGNNPMLFVDPYGTSRSYWAGQYWSDVGNQMIGYVRGLGSLGTALGTLAGELSVDPRGTLRLMHEGTQNLSRTMVDSLNEAWTSSLGIDYDIPECSKMTRDAIAQSVRERYQNWDAETLGEDIASILSGPSKHLKGIKQIGANANVSGKGLDFDGHYHQKAIDDAKSEPRRTSSQFEDVTRRGRVENRQTDVPRSEFEANLTDSGFTKTMSKDGKVSIFQKAGSETITIRDTSRSTGTPTAEIRKNGETVMKIRLPN